MSSSNKRIHVKHGHFVKNRSERLVELEKQLKQTEIEYENIVSLLQTMKVSDVGFDEMIKTRNLLSVKLDNAKKKIQFKKICGNPNGNPVEARYGGWD